MQSQHAEPSIGLHRYAVVTAAATFVLIVAGGLVTSTDSGLSVPDWPLSYGTLAPPMVGGIAVEHTHRMIAGTVGLLIAALAAWLWRRERRGWVRRLGGAALAGVVVQALLGGLTVLLLLPPAVSVAHACLGQTVWCLTVVLAVVTSPRWRGAPEGGESPLGSRAWALVAAVFGQLILGAVMRHSGRLFWAHAAWALGVAGVVAWTLAATAGGTAARRVALGVAGLVILQVLLGLGIVASAQHPLVTTAHVAVGALVLAGSCALVTVAWRPRVAVSPAPAPVSCAP